MEAVDTIKKLLLDEIPDIVGIYLFGSQADGRVHDESDYDIAFLTKAPRKLEALFLFDLSNKLASALSVEVDLVDVYAVSLDLRFEIVTKGKRIYCSDQTACDTFDMISISMYQRFEEERREVVEAYKKRVASWQTP